MSAEEWVGAVDEIMKRHELDEKIMIAAMRNQMGGIAKHWYNAHARSNTDWETVKTKLLEYFEGKTTPMVAIMKLMSNKRKMIRGQTLAQYFLEMEALAGGSVEEKDLVTLIIRGTGDQGLTRILETGTQPSMKELWKHIQCIQNLPWNVYAGDWDARPKRIGGQGGSNYRPTASGKSNHCYVCGDTGHLARNFPLRSHKEDTSQERCYVCKEAGHVARNYPIKTKQGGTDKCYACQEIGHLARNCPLAKIGRPREWQQTGGANTRRERTMQLNNRVGDEE